MDYKISIIDLLKIDEQVLRTQNSDFAVYSGISEYDIPLGTVFNTLIDSKDHDKQINGEFKIEHIIILSKEASHTIKGYHAVLFISSNVEFKYILNYMTINNSGNFSNVCYLQQDK